MHFVGRMLFIYLFVLFLSRVLCEERFYEENTKQAHVQNADRRRRQFVYVLSLSAAFLRRKIEGGNLSVSICCWVSDCGLLHPCY